MLLFADLLSFAGLELLSKRVGGEVALGRGGRLFREVDCYEIGSSRGLRLVREPAHAQQLKPTKLEIV
jgi:hypothetical protein